MTSFVTLGDMVGLAIGTPELGTVNFHILQALLRSLIEMLKLSEMPTEYDSKAIQEMRKVDSKKEALDLSGVFHIPELIRRRSSLGRRTSISEEGGFEIPSVPSHQEYFSKDEIISYNRRFSTGMIRADEKARPIQFGKKNLPMLLSPAAGPAPQVFLTLKELEKKVDRLENNWNRMNETMGRKLDQAENKLLERGQSQDLESKDKEGQNRSPISVHELWNSVQLEKKVEANTDGITKLMSLTQEIIKRLQKLSESRAKMQRTEDEKVWIASEKGPFAKQSDLEALQSQTTMLSGTLRGIQPAINIMNNFVTWTGLELTLQGEEPPPILPELLVESEPPKMMKKTSAKGKILKSASSDREGKWKISEPGTHSKGTADQQDILVQQGVDVTETDHSVKSDHLIQTSSAGDLIHQHDAMDTGLKVTGSQQETEEIEDAHSGHSSMTMLSGRSEVTRAESKATTVGSRSSAMGLTPGLSSRLHALGKLDERIDKIVKTLKDVKGSLNEKIEANLKPSTVRLDDVAQKVEVVSKELDKMEVTRKQVALLRDQLSSTHLPYLKFSQSILATAPDSRRHKHEDSGQLHPSRSVALGAIEQSMKTIDDTFAVLQHSIKDQHEKFNKQMELLEQRFDRWRLAELEADPDARINEAEIEEGGVGLRTKLGKLEMMMNEKNEEIVKIKSDMKLLVDDISSNAKDVALNMDDMIVKLKHEIKFNRTDLVLQSSDAAYVMHAIRDNFNELVLEFEKMKKFIILLHDLSQRQQMELHNNIETTEQLKKENEEGHQEMMSIKATLQEKVDGHRFDTMCDDFSKSINAMLGRISLLDHEWRTSFDKLSDDVAETKEDIDSINGSMVGKIREISKKLHIMQKHIDSIRLLSDDAALVKRQLFSCLSCDRPVVLSTGHPKPSLSCRDGLFTRRTVKPYITYELEQLRQSGKRMVNLSNYERALHEKNLTRSEIRDLRSDCANYWRQPHRAIHTSQRLVHSQKRDTETSFVDDFKVSRLSSGKKRQSSAKVTTFSNYLDDQNMDKLSSAEEEDTSCAPSSDRSRSRACNRGSSQLGDDESAEVEVFHKGSKPETMAHQTEHDETDVLASPTAVVDSISLSGESDTTDMQVHFVMPLIDKNTASSEIKHGIQRKSLESDKRKVLPATPVKRRGTPFVTNVPAYFKRHSIPKNAAIEEVDAFLTDDEQGNRRKSMESDNKKPPITTKRRGTPYVNELTLNFKKHSIPKSAAIEEDDDSPTEDEQGNRRKSVESDKKKPPITTKRRGTPYVNELTLDFKKHSIPKSAAIEEDDSLTEDEQGNRRKSKEFDKRKPPPVTTGKRRGTGFVTDLPSNIKKHSIPKTAAIEEDDVLPTEDEKDNKTQIERNTSKSSQKDAIPEDETEK